MAKESRIPKLVVSLVAVFEDLLNQALGARRSDLFLGFVGAADIVNRGTDYARKGTPIGSSEYFVIVGILQNTRK
ncbi:hypothetical protein BH18ACI4_BH18ACI4_11920 [soil metagenome]